MYDGLNFKCFRQRWRQLSKNYTTIADVTKRNKNGQTTSGLYSLFIPMEWNYEGFMDSFGLPIFTNPKDPVKTIDGGYITTGVIQHWNNEVDGLKTRSRRFKRIL